MPETKPPPRLPCVFDFPGHFWFALVGAPFDVPYRQYEEAVLRPLGWHPSPPLAR